MPRRWPPMSLERDGTASELRSFGDNFYRRHGVIVDPDRLDRRIEARTKPHSKRQRRGFEVSIFEELPSPTDAYERRHFVVPISINAAVYSHQSQFREIRRVFEHRVCSPPKLPSMYRIR